MQVTLIKNGDHRLSSPAELAVLMDEVINLARDWHQRDFDPLLQN